MSMEGLTGLVAQCSTVCNCTDHGSNLVSRKTLEAEPVGAEAVSHYSTVVSALAAHVGGDVAVTCWNSITSVLFPHALFSRLLRWMFLNTQADSLLLSPFARLLHIPWSSWQLPQPLAL
jgi:hypothetical protein